MSCFGIGWFRTRYSIFITKYRGFHHASLLLGLVLKISPSLEAIAQAEIRAPVTQSYYPGNFWKLKDKISLIPFAEVNYINSIKEKQWKIISVPKELHPLLAIFFWIRLNLNWTLRKISSLKGLSSTGTGCPGRGWVTIPEVFKRHVDVACRDVI